MSTNQNFQTHRYLLQTIDPVHIGTGGMRLGRVDNSIVREPGTRLPKIPGTSLSGAIRHYAAYRYGKKRCAGQGQEQKGHAGHCRSPTCPICYTFGSVSGDSEGEDGQKDYAGVVSIGDARLLLFPVYSMAGPVWVTSPSALGDFGIVGQGVHDDMAKLASGLSNHKHLNLGWLMVENKGDLALKGLPDNLPAPVGGRIVLVSDKVFSQVVNSNLEVRTSVSIDPETGAAEDKALFTYEAIPRATFLWMDVVVDDYRDREIWQNGGVVWKAYKEKLESDDGKKVIWHDNDRKAGPLYPDPKSPEQLLPEKSKEDEGKGWCSPADVVKAGLEWAEHLGVGGMGTRGFGRIRTIDCRKVR